TALDAGKADLWDSGKVEEENPLHVAYAGKPLKPHTTYYWKVRVWNRSGKGSAYSKIQQFHIGDALRERQWPGESRWGQLDTTQLKRKPNGTWFVAFERAGFANVALTLNWKTAPGDRKDTTLTVRIGEKNVGDSIDAKPGGGVIYREYPLRIKAGRHTYQLDI